MPADDVFDPRAVQNRADENNCYREMSEGLQFILAWPFLFHKKDILPADHIYIA
jgi:hypothetical protein